MSFFEKIFNWGSDAETQNQPAIPFGRYTDVYKTPRQYDAWDQAVELFEKEERMEAYRAFLVYLRDEKEESVTWTEAEGRLDFQIQQGSRLITGFADGQRVKARSDLARAETTSVGFMRRLIEYNFTLKYCRFGLSPDNVISILFDTSVLDGSPLKLYNALKELAITADKQDDLLLDEFKMLHPIEPLMGEPVPELEKMVKYEFVQQEIKKAFEEFDKAKPDPNQYPGGYAYMLLHTAYKLDYLVKPEGFMMETLERVHKNYFAAGEEKTTQLKNIALRKELQKLLDRPKEEFFKEMYRTRCTFGITTPVNHDRLATLIEGELSNMDWYRDNNHHFLALAVPGYIVGYALFNYALPKPDKQLLHLYFQIMELAYFRNLGFQLPFSSAKEKGKPDAPAIKKAIQRIASENKKMYPNLAPDTSELDFSMPVHFARTYLEMIKNLDLTKAD